MFLSGKATEREFSCQSALPSRRLSAATLQVSSQLWWQQSWPYVFSDALEGSRINLDWQPLMSTKYKPLACFKERNPRLSHLCSTSARGHVPGWVTHIAKAHRSCEVLSSFRRRWGWVSLPVYLAQGHAEGECVPGDSYLGGGWGWPPGLSVCLSLSLC